MLPEHSPAWLSCFLTMVSRTSKEDGLVRVGLGLGVSVAHDMEIPTSPAHGAKALNPKPSPPKP